MINTITLNPSIDYIMNLEEATLGLVNRSDKEEVFPGGKGINISLVLKNLGIQSRVLGFIAGFTGQEIERLIKEEGIISEFINIDNGFSRINIKLKHGDETEINGNGPNIDEDHIKQLYRKIEKMKEKDFLVLAGSIPNTVRDNIYERIIRDFRYKNFNIVVDATKNLLINVLKYNPFLIKPNKYELEELFGIKLRNNAEIIEYGKKLQFMGAQNVLISMAGEGAIFLGNDGTILESGVPMGKVINSVGAGDSMIAGFLAEYIQSNNYEKAFKMGIASGSATAFSLGLASKDNVEELLKQLNKI